MPSPQQLKELSEAIEAQQARLAAAEAKAPPGAMRDQIGQTRAMLSRALKDLLDAAEKHNQDLAAARKTVQESVQKAEAKAAEKRQNRPVPKPRRVKPGLVHDPHLEEKLQLALRTPFGNRGQAP
jgi:hypothetical protein